MFLILEFLVVLCIFMCRKRKENKLETSGKKGTFVGYSENSKAYRIYVFGQREVEISHDVTFDEDFSLGKVRDLPIPRKGYNVDAGKKDESPTDELIPNVEGPMDPIDPPPSDPPYLKEKSLLAQRYS